MEPEWRHRRGREGAAIMVVTKAAVRGRVDTLVVQRSVWLRSPSLWWRYWSMSYGRRRRPTTMNGSKGGAAQERVRERREDKKRKERDLFDLWHQMTSICATSSICVSPSQLIRTLHAYIMCFYVCQMLTLGQDMSLSCVFYTTLGINFLFFPSFFLFKFFIL